MNIVILGASSGTAQGLAPRLQADGHTCVAFNRGPLGREGSTIRGPLESMHENPHFPERADWIINCIILRDRSIEENVAYCGHVLDLARRLKCRGVIHLSSVVTFKFDGGAITEESARETEHKDKPFYSGVKIATDEALRDASNGMPVVFVRPGFILGPGHPNVIVGTAAKVFGGWIVLLGNPRQILPVIPRTLVQEALARIVQRESWPHGESILLVDPQSPSKRDFVRASMSELGQGTHLLAMGRWFWWPAALAGEVLARLLGQKHPNVWRRIAATFRGTTYNSTGTENKLGMKLASPWRESLRTCYDDQQPNFTIPPAPPALDTKAWASLSSVLFIGFGSIVAQKHMPALRQLGFRGRVDIVDPGLRAAPPCDLQVRLLARAAESDATVVIIASPPAHHMDALTGLPQTARTVLVEKPLALNQEEVARAKTITAERGIRLVVLHNYRFKKNTLAFHEFMRRVNPGVLRGAHILMDTGSIGGDSSAWRRNERVSRTLLYDCGLHYLDTAASLGGKYQRVTDLTWKINKRGEATQITGTAQFDNLPIQFHLAQGNNLSRHRVSFDFTNYSVRLTFYPDTFTVIMGNDMILNRAIEGWNEFWTMVKWAWGKIRKRDPDQSHVLSLAHALSADGRPSDARLEIDNVEATYRMLDEIGAKVYAGR